MRVEIEINNCPDFVTEFSQNCLDFVTKFSDNCLDFVTKFCIFGLTMLQKIDILGIMTQLTHIQRNKLRSLEQWKSNTDRKPLVIRGARQVGKTTLVNEFAKSYQQYIYLNLEKLDDKMLFEEFNTVHELVDALLLRKNLDTSAINNTLLFIDEVQESPQAMGMLRYFYEEMQQLHVIAAGSLLEHTLSSIKNFPVGRVNYLYLFPLNFQEFLRANNQIKLLERLDKVPVSKAVHKTAMDWFHKYAIIGGMPEVVKNYVQTQQISSLPIIYESIWATYKDDVEKYASNKTEERVIKHIMNIAPYYLDERIKFQNFGKSNYKSREVGESFRNLDEAKVIQLIYPTTDTTLPIVADIAKSPRMQFLDTGIVNYTLGIQAELMAMDDLSNSYKGALIPHLITQELISLNTFSYKKPNFWVREKRQSSAEVDLVFPFKNLLIPIKIKSGKTGNLKSLHQFVDQSEHKFAVRIYGGKFSIEEARTPKGTEYTLMNLPYYLGTYVEKYLEYFVTK